MENAPGARVDAPGAVRFGSTTVGGTAGKLHSSRTNARVLPTPSPQRRAFVFRPRFAVALPVGFVADFRALAPLDFFAGFVSVAEAARLVGLAAVFFFALRLESAPAPDLALLRFDVFAPAPVRSAICAAVSRAMGTRNGEQLT